MLTWMLIDEDADRNARVSVRMLIYDVVQIEMQGFLVKMLIDEDAQIEMQGFLVKGSGPGTRRSPLFLPFFSS